MDTKVSAPTRVEEILNEWDLNNTLTTSTVYSSAQDTISISSALNNALNNVSITSPYTVTGAIGSGINFPNSVYTIGTAGTNTAPWLTSNPTGAKITLNGEGADIKVNGWSLVDAVKRIEERLGLFQPNPELEREWEDLRALGEQYRALEQHIKDKQATFDRLKSMPPVENL
jgi:hypothetical protein